MLCTEGTCFHATRLYCIANGERSELAFHIAILGMYSIAYGYTIKILTTVDLAYYIHTLTQNAKRVCTSSSALEYIMQGGQFFFLAEYMFFI